MRYAEAEALKATLDTSARQYRHLGPDGKPVVHKVYHTNEGRKGRLTVDGWTIKAVELVEKTNLQSGHKFWIDRDTPPFLDPSCDSYYD